MDFLGFLKYGGLGLAAMICVIVLFYNAANLNKLVKEAEPERIEKAKPLLLMQMAISLVGLIAVGGGAMVIAYFEIGSRHCAEITLDPRDSIQSLTGNGFAEILIDEQPFDRKSRNILISGVSGRERKININIEPYVLRRLTAAAKADATIIPLSETSGLAEPGS